MFISYLWGIETSCLYLHFEFRFMFISYLWGIETKKSDRKIIYRYEVYILPMRNWNERAKTNVKKAIEFISYLWGIETNNTKKKFQKPGNGLYLTYEELKLPPYIVSSRNGFRLYLTYEELKHEAEKRNVAVIKKFISYLWGIETHVNKSEIIILSFKFISYLWGIETWHMQEILRISQAFISYLWGIET